MVTAMVAEDVQSHKAAGGRSAVSAGSSCPVCADSGVSWWDTAATLSVYNNTTADSLTITYYEITQVVASHRGKQYWRFSVSRTKHDMEVDRRILHCSFASSDIPQ